MAKIPKITPKKAVGNIGEDVACKYLKKYKHKILERNYWKKCGEIDVITEKSGNLHFVEVKTVTRENNRNVSHETFFRPEENVDRRKLTRMNRAIQIYLEEKDISEEVEWQIDVIAITLNMKTRRARVEAIENVIFE